MKLNRSSVSSTVVITSLALVLAACSEPPVAPDRSPEPSAANAARPGDRYLVLMKESQGLSAQASSAFSTEVVRLGGGIERSLNGIGALQVRNLTRAAAAELAQRPEVQGVALDRKLTWIPSNEKRRSSLVLPDHRNPRQAAFFDRFQWNLKRIQANRAWSVTPQGAGVTVCVLDTGVDPRHIDLRGKLNTDISASFVATERADRDLAGHGTAMSSTITSNSIGVAAVAPEAELCSVKVLDRNGSGTFGDVSAGIMYVGDAGRIDGTSRVAVANMSLGVVVPRNDPDVRVLMAAMQRAVDYSTSRGVLFVASSGNDGLNLNDPDIVHLPSGLENVISVGATGPIRQQNFDHVASYSNVGRRGVDVFAPGGEFAFRRNVIEDLIVSACSPSIRIPEFECVEDDYVLGAGTSDAAAHVSGEAAVIESELPGNQTPAQLAACILRTADPLPNPLITAHGRINVFRAQACGV